MYTIEKAIIYLKINKSIEVKYIPTSIKTLNK